MASKIKITDQTELVEFVRTHLDHRLTALVAPLFDDANAYRVGRGDISKAAQEGSYVMLRLFIEFLGVKGDRNSKGKLVPNLGDDDDLRLSAFSKYGVQNVDPNQFGIDQSFIADIHRTLCKINAHFTYDVKEAKFYDRIASLPRPDLERAVKIVIGKLDEFFFQKVKLDIVVHRDLREPFKKLFADIIKSNVKSN
jgi:hypothetical protein